MRASIQGPPVFLETFYRSGQKSIGGHVFYDDDAWLATVLGTYDWRSVLVTAGLGAAARSISVIARRGARHPHSGTFGLNLTRPSARLFSYCRVL